MRNQIHAPQEERTQEYLPEFGIGLHDPPQVLSADFEHLAGFLRAAAHQTPAAGEKGDLAGELSANQHTEYGLASVRDAIDLDSAGEHHKNTVVRISLIEENFAWCGPTLVAEWRKARNLRIV
jgi:hypothetical protein